MEKQSIKAYQEFNQQNFTKRVIFTHNDTAAFVLNFLPGQKLPAHKHPGAQAYLFVVTGKGTIMINGDESEVNPGDVIYTTDEEELAFVNSGNEPVSLYVILNKIPNQNFIKNI